GRHPGYGAATLPLPVPILRGGGAPLLPALPALGRRISWRALQYCELRAAEHDDGTGHGPATRPVHPHLRRRPPLSQPSRAGRSAPHPHAAAAAAPENQSVLALNLRFPLRGFRPLGL